MTYFLDFIQIHDEISLARANETDQKYVLIIISCKNLNLSAVPNHYLRTIYII